MSDSLKTDHLEMGARVYLRPFGFVNGAEARDAVAAGLACFLAGGPVAFMGVELVRRSGGAVTRELLPVTAIAARSDVALTVTRMTAARRPLELGAGRRLSFERPLVMGILNVTPDSFSDGGSFATSEAALERGRVMLAEGADLLDVGGESTRPGSDPVAPEEEIRRVLPVIRSLVEDGAIISIDTRHAATMRAAAAGGAHIINDVSALGHDGDSLAAARELRLPVILMHAQGDPKTMQDAPVYDDALLDVYDYLADRIDRVTATTGVSRAQIVVDPGVGFGKGLEHNLDLLRGLSMFHGLGCPILLGVSRKSFIGRITGVTDPRERLPGGLAAELKAVLAGVQMLRVHDVAATVQALAVWDAL
ncbi:dihydropteroate synthase [Govanella unica]|uniref:dihydropteroate synthase n=1 Tax=Govanella unica TaxID=2975056 RepID=A0A9X3U007_9PROT|nr:dihydropteroate synthase [Govania unica]MDA5194921.1 dihydropteroate synthase [Govania unica]